MQKPQYLFPWNYICVCVYEHSFMIHKTICFFSEFEQRISSFHFCRSECKTQEPILFLNNIIDIITLYIWVNAIGVIISTFINGNCNDYFNSVLNNAMWWATMLQHEQKYPGDKSERDLLDNAEFVRYKILFFLTDTN